jgi:hypothetical protein
MIRFHGVFAPYATLRSEVVPKKDAHKLAKHSAAELGHAEQMHLFDDEPTKPKRKPPLALCAEDLRGHVERRTDRLVSGDFLAHSVMGRKSERTPAG